MLSVERHEADALFIEEELDFASGATAVLGKNKVGDILAIGIFIIVIFAINEEDDIGVLLDRTGFAEVGEHRNFWIALLDGTAEL